MQNLQCNSSCIFTLNVTKEYSPDNRMLDPMKTEIKKNITSLLMV